jgi:hypothetical protein
VDDVEHYTEKAEMPSHTPGCPRGEDLVRRKGREPGRREGKPHRTARDSTSVRPGDREPIDPRMPSMPPP